jgi:hypothetical protein
MLPPLRSATIVEGQLFWPSASIMVAVLGVRDVSLR